MLARASDPKDLGKIAKVEDTQSHGLWESVALQTISVNFIWASVFLIFCFVGWVSLFVS